MREFDPIPASPPVTRKAQVGILNRIAASYRDHEFYDGSRENGYGGYKDDGRWGPVAEALIKAYDLTEDSLVVQINCHKGFLLHELLKRGINVRGTEVSRYAISKVNGAVAPFVQYASFTAQPFADHEADLVLAMSPVYAGSLGDAIRCLREIARIGRGRSFITLAAADNNDDYWLLRKWFTLGSLILTRAEWIEVLNHVGYKGDFRYDTASSLNLS